jgi:hypothetical protein
MARLKKEQWVSGKEATRIISENSGRPIADSYVRLLASQGKIETREVDGRTNEYKLSDVSSYVVSHKRGKKPKSKKTTTGGG